MKLKFEAVQSTPMKSSVKIINKKNLWLYLKKCSLTVAAKQN